MEKDALLQAVPRDLVSVFRGRRTTLDACWELRECERYVREVLDGSQYASRMDRELIAGLFSLIRREIEENLPAYVCKRCVTRPDPQCHCRGKRWLTQRESEVPGVARRLFASTVF